VDLMELEFEASTIQAFRRVALEGACEQVAQELGLSVGAVYAAKSGFAASASRSPRTHRRISLNSCQVSRHIAVTASGSLRAVGGVTMHKSEVGHPSVERPRAFAQGEVGEEELSRLSRHLDECKSCGHCSTSSPPTTRSCCACKTQLTRRGRSLKTRASAPSRPRLPQGTTPSIFLRPCRRASRTTLRKHVCRGGASLIRQRRSSGPIPGHGGPDPGARWSAAGGRV
jgi:hypothetical protein